MTESGTSVSAVKYVLVVFGTLANLGLALHQYFFFLRAYADPAKGAVLLINVYGEANAELFLLTICAIVGTLGTFILLKALNDSRKTGKIDF